jgi:hypothetical protein
MATTIVNGYVCTSSCDVAKAKKGVDPHPKPGAAPEAKDDKVDHSGRANEPAVIFGGSLARLRGSASVGPAGGVSSTATSDLPTKTFGVDLLL